MSIHDYARVRTQGDALKIAAFSTMAPASGLESPWYKLRNPYARTVFLKASNGPLNWSCVCCSTLTVSNGYLYVRVGASVSAFVPGLQILW